MRRRDFLRGTPASAALLLPSVAIAQPVESLTDRIERLTHELSDAMAEYSNGQFKAVVGPDDDVVFQNRREKTAKERFDYHLAEFKRAAEELDPMIGNWHLATPEVAGEPMCLYANRITGRYVGDGIYESGQEIVRGFRNKWEVRLTDVVIDGSRTFMVECPGERMRLLEHVLETYIGKRIGDLP